MILRYSLQMKYLLISKMCFKRGICIQERYTCSSEISMYTRRHMFLYIDEICSSTHTLMLEVYLMNKSGFFVKEVSFIICEVFQQLRYRHKMKGNWIGMCHNLDSVHRNKILNWLYLRISLFKVKEKLLHSQVILCYLSFSNVYFLIF